MKVWILSFFGREPAFGRCSSRLAGLGTGLALALAAPRAVAEGSTVSVSLSYEVDPNLVGCPSETEFRRGVVEQLGHDPFRADGEHQVRARVVGSEHGLDGQVEWSDRRGVTEGERHLSSPRRDCAEFVRGVAFALAVQIQLLERLASTPAVAEPSPPPRAQQPAGAEPPPATSASVVPRAGAVLSAGFGTNIAFGVAPSASAGGQLFLGLRYRAVSFELGTQANLPVTLHQADGSGFSASSLGETLALCGHLDQFALCPLAQLSLLRIRGFGVDEARSPTAFRASAGLRAALEAPLSAQFALRMRADGVRSLATRTVSLNAVPVWETPGFSLTCGIDFALHFR
ncbi:MAG TPA: hypothetical protein VNW92_11270 [Polyangiaceae bacterium]|jgi:hypothetical protein|nr:hypothetical protein [Polyangiaceae bacterium]